MEQGEKGVLLLAREVESRRVPSLREFWETYQLRLRGKEKTRYNYSIVLRNVEHWMDLPVNEITGPMLAELHARITRKEGGRGGPIIANKVVDLIGYLYSVGLRIHKTETTGIENPAQYLTDLRLRNPMKSKLGCHIPVDKFADWWEGVERYEAKGDPWNSRRDLLKFLVLTGLRIGESQSLLWSEVDFRERVIRFDGSRNKTGKAHVLPMSTKVLRLLAEREVLERESKYVFIGGVNRDAFIRTMKNCCDEIGEQTGTPFTPHDLRRTFLLLLDHACMDVPDTELRKSARDICTHKPASDTLMQHYLTVNPERLRPLMQRVSRYVDYLLLQGNLRENEKPLFPQP